MEILRKATMLQYAFSQQLFEMNGYETQTTFYHDFSIADVFGEEAVFDTFERAFKSWKNNVIYLTELSIVLNHKIWEHYHAKNEKLARAYDLIWRRTDDYCVSKLKDDDLSYYLRVTD